MADWQVTPGAGLEHSFYTGGNERDRRQVEDIRRGKNTKRAERKWKETDDSQEYYKISIWSTEHDKSSKSRAANVKAKIDDIQLKLNMFNDTFAIGLRTFHSEEFQKINHD